MPTLLDIILSHFFVRGKPAARWRNIKTGRFVKTPKFYRFTWGIKGIPYEHESNCSATLFYWGFTCGVDGENFLLRELEHYLGYPRKLWWFSYAVGFGQQEVKYDSKLEGKTEFEFRRRQ